MLIHQKKKPNKVTKNIFQEQFYNSKTCKQRMISFTF